MKLEGVIPVIHSRQPEALLAFYQEALQYVVINQRKGDDGLEWAHLRSGQTYLMLLKQDYPQPPSDALLLYYYTDDVQSFHRYLTARGYPVGELTTTAFGMQEFYLQDPEGHRLAVGQKQAPSA